MMRKLDEYGYGGSLMLEVFQNTDEYKRMSHEQFLATCYERIKKISQM
jgi:sugar phosphate isomerase/epimerase